MPPEVSLVRCGSYGREEVYKAVRKSVGLIGGIRRFVKPGETVLVKPNMLSARPPEEAVTTHPEVVRAVIKLIREAEGAPRVGDSHGGSHHRMEEVYEKTGIGKVCDEEKVEKLVFEKFRKIDGIPVALEALEADSVVSVPRFKTHSLTLLTAGVKNMFGIVPGLFKTRCHMEAPNPAAFAKLLAKVYSFRPPSLTVLDGVTAMEGEGPGSAGTPKKMDLIAASCDAASLDETLCRIMGVNPEEVPLLRETRKIFPARGEAEIEGEKWEAFHKEDFKLPGGTFLHRLPNAVLRPAALLLKTFPDVNPANCTRCGVCLKNCPAGAITEKKGGLVFNRHKCILCLCCLEFCPHNAIAIRKNPIFRLVRPG